MATLLTKPVTRELAFKHLGRDWLMTVRPNDTISFREKGTRKSYDVPITACIDLAAKVEARK